MTNKTWQKWTEEDDRKLREHWPTSDMETLMAAFPNRQYNSLMVRAVQKGIKAVTRRSRVNGDILMLKERSKEAFYVWGFLLADGCFTTKNDLTISQSLKEKEFFEKFISLMGGKKEKIKCRRMTNGYCPNGADMMVFRIGNKAVLDEMRQRIGLRIAKTYNPPTKIDYFFDKNLFIHMLIGLIDGDGCAWLTFSGPKRTPWPNIRVEMHCHWLPILEMFVAKLKEFYGIEAYTRMSNRGFAQLVINKKEDVKTLLEASKQTLRMERKWVQFNDLYKKDDCAHSENTSSSFRVLTAS